MEMHQVRYFLAVARTLNFTRAAEECHVAQPSLTRAIRQLEGELGGDLFRRERPQSQLTELGQRMLPLLKQCYDSAVSARSLASAIKSGEVGSLRLALSHTIDPSLVMPHVVELGKLFKGLELKLYRGNSEEVLAYLKRGDAELGLGAGFGDEWERLDSWPLFTEDFQIVVHSMHRLANAASVGLGDLKQERFVFRTYCEIVHPWCSSICGRRTSTSNVAMKPAPNPTSSALLEAGVGVALLPRSTKAPDTLLRAHGAGARV